MASSAEEEPSRAWEQPSATWEMENFSQSDARSDVMRRRLSRRSHSEHHRRHEFPGVRLESYTDAVFAIVGTILIAYLNQTVVPRLEDPNNSILQNSLDNFEFFTVYHFTFLHISVIWLNHTRVFSLIERVNDIVIWMNMVFLYFVSFVPLTFGLLGEFNGTYEGIVFPSITIILINTMMAVMVWYVCRRKRFLPNDMSDNFAKYLERAMYFKLLITPVFASLAIGFGYLNLPTGQVLFYSSVFVVLIPKMVAYYIWWRRKTEITAQIVQVLSSSVSKDRIEFFTDGVYSIIATLVILDVTMTGIPSRDVVNKNFNGSLVEALGDHRLDYVTYFSTFLIISLLWFVHHSLFNFIKKFNPLMFLVHQISLSFVGVVPAAVELFAVFYEPDTRDADKVTAIQVVAVGVGVVSLLQFLLLALMSFADDECVDQTLFHSKSSLHLLVKVTIIPTTCVVGYWCSMGSEDVRMYAFIVVNITIPLAFVLINILIKSTTLHVLFKYCWEKLKSTHHVKPYKEDNQHSQSGNSHPLSNNNEAFLY